MQDLFKPWVERLEQHAVKNVKRSYPSGKASRDELKAIIRGMRVLAATRLSDLPRDEQTIPGRVVRDIDGKLWVVVSGTPNGVVYCVPFTHGDCETGPLLSLRTPFLAEQVSVTQLPHFDYELVPVKKVDDE